MIRNIIGRMGLYRMRLIKTLLVSFNFLGRYSSFDISFFFLPAPGHLVTILDAMNEFHTKTCLKFRPRRRADQNFIHITGDRAGCWTTVGMRGGEQIVSLSVKDNCVTYGRTIHELMHVLGFYHQHSASNRDNYVEVLWANVLKSKEYNFLRYNDTDVTDFGVPYDYNSILHYPAEAASSNRKPTLVALKKNVQIGQRLKLSTGDVTKIKRMYHHQCSRQHLEKSSLNHPNSVVVVPGRAIKAPLPRWLERFQHNRPLRRPTSTASPVEVLKTPVQHRRPHLVVTHQIDQKKFERIEGNFPTGVLINGTTRSVHFSHHATLILIILLGKLIMKFI